MGETKADAEQARATLDSDLGVREWQVSARVRRPRVPVEEGAPAWWYSDEEASQSFLREMGVH